MLIISGIVVIYATAWLSVHALGAHGAHGAAEEP